MSIKPTSGSSSSSSTDHTKRSEPEKPRTQSSTPPTGGKQHTTSFEPAAKRPVALDGGASSLRTEVLGDGRANCLEQATRLARPGDNVVLLQDANDPVGHAVVQRPDGSVIDPNTPGITYPDLGSWQASHPEYHSPVKVPALAVQQVLSAPPGPQRDAAIAKLGLNGVADRRVADNPYPATVRVDASSGLNLRQGPNSASTSEGLLPNGTELTVLGRDEATGWLHVQTQDGRTGYVHPGYVQATDGQSYPGIGDLGDSTQHAQGGAGATAGFQEGSIGAASEVSLGSQAEGRTQENLNDRTPHFSQGDPTYTALPIPGRNGTETTINAQGCLITCKAMAISAYQNGDGQPLVSPGDLSGTSPGDRVTVGDRTFVDHTVGFSQENIDNALAQGHPVAVRLDGPNGEHWVLITGKNPDGSYIARDPGYRVAGDSNSNCQDITLTWENGTLTGDVPFNGGTYTANTSVDMHVYAPEGTYTP